MCYFLTDNTNNSKKNDQIVTAKITQTFRKVKNNMKTLTLNLCLDTILAH